jgi:hypothetical protein
MHTKISLENQTGKEYLEDLRIDGRIMFERLFGKQSERCGLDASGLGSTSDRLL